MNPTAYLFFKGNCLEAMSHYAETLGGKVEMIVRNADAPDRESRMPGGDDLIMHMSISLGDRMIFASDAPDGMYRKPQGFFVSLTAAARADFDRIYAALARDAEAVMMPPGETFWAERFAMFTDRYGTPWMLSVTGTKGA